MNNKTQRIKIRIGVIGVILFFICYLYLGLNGAKTQAQFSITATDLNRQNHYIYYDANEKIQTEILVSPDTAQYPLGFADVKNHLLYYIKNVGNEDQVYAYSIENRKETVFTDQLYAVNDMITCEGTLYLTAEVKGQRAISLMALKNGKIQVISPLYFNVESISYKKSEKKIYFVGYDMKEQSTYIDEYEKSQKGSPAKNATSQIYTYDIVKNNLVLEYESEDCISKMAVMQNQDRAIIKYSKDLFTDVKFCWLNLETDLMEEGFVIKDIVRIDEMAFSKDDSFLYFLGVDRTNSYDEKDATQTAPRNSLFKYDLESTLIERLLTYKDKYMNNFKLLD